MKVRSCFVSNSSSSSFIVAYRPNEKLSMVLDFDYVKSNLPYNDEEERLLDILYNDYDILVSKENMIKIDLLKHYTRSYLNITKESFEPLDGIVKDDDDTDKLETQYFARYIPDSLDTIKNKDIELFMNVYSFIFSFDELYYKSILGMSKIFFNYCNDIFERIHRGYTGYRNFFNEYAKEVSRNNVYEKVYNFHDDFISEDKKNKIAEDLYFGRLMKPDTYMEEDLEDIFKFIFHTLYSYYFKKYIACISIPYDGETDSILDMIVAKEFIKRCKFNFDFLMEDRYINL